MGREQAGDAAPRRARSASAVDLGRVVDAGADPPARPSPSSVERLGAQPRPAAQRRLALELELARRPRSPPSSASARRLELEPALDRLVALARRPAGSAPSRPARRSGSASSTHSTRRWSKVVGAALGVGRRVDDPERGRGRVLGRARRVRIERVALVEQRGDELLELLAHQPSSLVEQLVDDRVEGRQPALGLAPLEARRASRRGPGPRRGTGRRRRSSARQTSTGIAKRGERSQGIWTICIRPSSAS